MEKLKHGELALIKSIRLKIGVKQIDVAKAIKMNKIYLSELEQGRGALGNIKDHKSEIAKYLIKQIDRQISDLDSEINTLNGYKKLLLDETR